MKPNGLACAAPSARAGLKQTALAFVNAGGGQPTPVFNLVELVFAPEGQPESSPAPSGPGRRVKDELRPVGTRGGRAGRAGIK
jgi:hypothetical protein